MQTVTSYSFSVNGLSITYTFKGQTTTWTLDPKAACDVFQTVGIVEGWDTDKNSEPVILWQDRMYGRPVVEHCLWVDFVKTFPFIQRHAEIIIEDRERRKASRQFHVTMNRLLLPLQAA